ncbi:MAG: amidohydrolase family protein [Acidimicrobiaceae bacterium]|nr:amidohydrolase family protein [Acidimicrobiaceae bacterium]
MPLIWGNSREAKELRVIDPDAHFFEPLDWLHYADPELAAQLPPPRSFGEVLIRRVAEGRFSDHRAIEDPLELIASENLVHIKKSNLLQPEHQEGSSDEFLPYYDGAARLEVCDAEGIDIQFVNPTAGLSQLTYQVSESGHPELTPRALNAWNRWAAGQLHGYTDRLMPVTQIDPANIEWSIAEMTRMREAGSRAFHLTQNRIKSYTHPDYEPLWSAAEDLGMAGYVHIQFGTPADASYANNGRPDFQTFAHLGGIGEAAPTRQFLMAMAFDGVFERHPRLRLILAECGHSWFPALLFDIDAKTSKIAMDGLPQESFYRLPLKPSEYIRRQVRLTALAGFIESGQERLTVEETLEQLPDPDLFVFSSDYPHIEGRKSAVPFFEKLLPPDERLRERFFGGSMAQFMGL